MIQQTPPGHQATSILVRVGKIIPVWKIFDLILNKSRYRIT